MAIINGLISGKMSNIHDIFGKNTVKDPKIGNGPESLKQAAQSIYISQKSSIIQETLDLIEKVFSQKMIVEIPAEDNAEEIEKIKKGVIILKEQLKIFAQKSEVSAALLKKALTNPNFKFFPIADNETLEALNINPNCPAVYMPLPENNVIIVPVQNLAAFANRGNFYDILTHELTHAADDFACKDKDAKKPEFLSKDKLKKEIQPMLSAEMERTKKLMGGLKEIRIKKLEEKNTGISEAQIKDAIDKKPLYYIDANSKEEFELIKNSTWCWYDFNGGRITVPFIYYLEGRGDLDILTQEYVAYGVQFFNSDDASKKERLQKQAPEFYDFLDKKFIPAITK